MNSNDMIELLFGLDPRQRPKPPKKPRKPRFH